MPINRPKTSTIVLSQQSDVLQDLAADPDNPDNSMDKESIEEPFVEQAALEACMLSFIGSYLDLVSQPTQAQIVALAQSLCVDPMELQAVIVAVKGTSADDEMKNAIRESNLRGEPGVNIPGDLDSFSYEDINPIGTTNLQQIEVPELKIQPLLSKKKVQASDGFLMPMDDDVDPNPEDSPSVATADLAPTNHRTGIDDGSPVSVETDDEEQRALINDGEIDDLTQKEDFDANRYLDDDGLF